MITDAPVRQPITHEDLQTTPVPVFDCAFCLRDSQAQLQAFLDVGEKSLWHGWANNRRIEIAPNQADLEKQIEVWNAVLKNAPTNFDQNIHGDLNYRAAVFALRENAHIRPFIPGLSEEIKKLRNE